MTAFEALVLIASLKFEPLVDREGFAGVESENALVAYSDTATVVIDGDMVQFMYDDGEFESFRLR
jgi:hypothetical protein